MYCIWYEWLQCYSSGTASPNKTWSPSTSNFERFQLSRRLAPILLCLCHFSILHSVCTVLTVYCQKIHVMVCCLLATCTCTVYTHSTMFYCQMHNFMYRCVNFWFVHTLYSIYMNCVYAEKSTNICAVQPYLASKENWKFQDLFLLFSSFTCFETILPFFPYTQW